MWGMKEKKESQAAPSLALQLPSTSPHGQNKTLHHQGLTYFSAGDGPLLLQGQHPLVPSDSAHMSWFPYPHHLSSEIVL